MRLHFVLLALFVGIAGVTVKAAPATRRAVHGTVLKPDGKPAAGAEVCLVRRTGPQSQASAVTASTRADAEGHFELTEAPAADGQRVPAAAIVVARLPGYSLDWATQPDTGQGPDLKLGPPGSFQATVQDSAGKPLPGVSVRLASLYRQPTSGVALRRFLMLPPELGERWAVTTNGSGRFGLADAGSASQVSFTLQAPGYNTREVYWSSGADPRAVSPGSAVTLFRKTAVQGQVQCGEPSVKLSGLMILCVAQGTYLGFGRTPIVVDDRGLFTIADVPPGPAQILLQPDPKMEWQVTGETKVELQEGQSLHDVVLKADAVKGTRVSGRVVAAETGQPVAHVSIYVNGIGGRWAGSLPVGSDGSYVFYSPPGDIQIQFALPQDSDYIKSQLSQRLTVSASKPVTIPDVRLKKGQAVQVQVVNEQGRPVMASVNSIANDDFPYTGGTMTDKLGKVVLRRVDPNRPLTLQATTATAISEPLKVDLRARKAPVKLVVRTGLAARLAGRVLDDRGQPVAHARVIVHTHMGNMTTMEPVLTTDTQGHFASAALQPQYAYGLQVEAPLHRRATRPEWHGQPGQRHDFGTIVLARRTGFVAGRIVDGSGAMVNAARVWTAGDNGTALETKSDADGRFKLEGLDSGACWVFAEKPGYELNGQLYNAPAADVTLTVSRSDQQPANTTTTSVGTADRTDRPDMQRVARRLLDRAVRAGEAPSTPARRAEQAELIGALARLDPERASEISSKAGGTYNDTIARSLGTVALQRNAEESAACFEQVKSSEMRTYALFDTARKIAASDPDKARILVQHALTSARLIRAVPYQVVMLAEIAGLMHQLGMPGSQVLLNGMVAKARGFAVTDWQAYARGVVAEQVSDYNLDAALALIEPINDAYEHQRHLGNIAYHIVLKSPEKARQLVDRTGSHCESHLARLCYRLAPVHPELADRFLAEIKEPQSKAQACLWMASETGPGDPKRAFAYLDAAFAALSGPDRRQDLYGSGTLPVMIATVAETAGRLGYPRTHALLLRALSLRGIGGPTYAVEEDPLLESDARLAVMLARADPALAREFVAPLLPRTLLKPAAANDYTAVETASNLALALLIADPDRCERYLEQLGAVHKSGDPGRLVEYALGDERRRRELLRNVSFYIMQADPEDDN